MPETKRIETPAPSPRISIAIDQLTWAIRDSVKRVLASHNVVLYAGQLSEVANNTAQAIISEGEEIETGPDHRLEIAQLNARIATLEAACDTSNKEVNKKHAAESRALADLALSQAAHKRQIDKCVSLERDVETLEADVERIQADLDILRCEAISRDMRELGAHVRTVIAADKANLANIAGLAAQDEALIAQAEALEAESAEYAALPETTHDRNALLDPNGLMAAHRDLDDDHEEGEIVYERYPADTEESLGLSRDQVWQ
jgi:chromosome segregation ATPase